MLEDVTSAPLYFYCKKRSAFQLKNKNLFLLLLLLSIIEISLPNVTNWIRPWSGLTAHEAWYALSWKKIENRKHVQRVKRPCGDSDLDERWKPWLAERIVC